MHNTGGQTTALDSEGEVMATQRQVSDLHACAPEGTRQFGEGRLGNS